MVGGEDGRVLFTGDNNRLVIGRGCLGSQNEFTLGDACDIVVGDDCRLAALKIWAKDRGRVRIGDRVVFTWHTRMFLHEPANLTLGNRCLIATDSVFTVSDMHSIIDIESGMRINRAKDIVLDEHVWIGDGAWVLKGAVIGRDCVIGARSVVTGRIPANCVAVGTPARVVKGGITWDGDLLPVTDR